MPRILVLLDPVCTVSEEDIRAELLKQYPADEFNIIDPQLLITGEPEEDIEPFAICWLWVLAAVSKYEAEVFIALTRRPMPDRNEELNFILAEIRPHKLFIFILEEKGGGLMQWVEKPENTFPLPSKDTLAMVFETIAANDKASFS